MESERSDIQVDGSEERFEVSGCTLITEGTIRILCNLKSLFKVIVDITNVCESRLR